MFSLLKFLTSLFSDQNAAPIPAIQTMVEVPSLISLCLDELKNDLVRGKYFPVVHTICDDLTLMFNVKSKIVSGDDVLPAIYELPFDLFDDLLMRLPPFALYKLQNEL